MLASQAFLQKHSNFFAYPASLRHCFEKTFSACVDTFDVLKVVLDSRPYPLVVALALSTTAKPVSTIYHQETHTHLLCVGCAEI